MEILAPILAAMIGASSGGFVGALLGAGLGTAAVFLAPRLPLDKRLRFSPVVGVLVGAVGASGHGALGLTLAGFSGSYLAQFVERKILGPHAVGQPIALQIVAQRLEAEAPVLRQSGVVASIATGLGTALIGPFAGLVLGLGAAWFGAYHLTALLDGRLRWRL